jgi:hypothetical protein
VYRYDVEGIGISMALDAVGLRTLNAVDPQLESAWF